MNIIYMNNIYEAKFPLKPIPSPVLNIGLGDKRSEF